MAQAIFNKLHAIEAADILAYKVHDGTGNAYIR